MTNNIDEIYTPLEKAKKEIWKRWKNEKLKDKVRKKLGKIPDIFNGQPNAVLFRFIATPDFEYMHARNLAHDLGLPLVYMEYLKDKFCTRNQDKVSLAKMLFFHGKNSKSECIVSKKKIIDLEKNDGKIFDKIKTRSGEKLIDLHHRLFKPHIKESKIIDISKLAKSNGNSSNDLYPYYLSIFTCFGILLEAYDLGNGDELKFARNTVLPAFEKVESEFGIRPLIVRLYDKNDEGNQYWSYYPEFLMKQISLN
jgi:hypothetical protein